MLTQHGLEWQGSLHVGPAITAPTGVSGFGLYVSQSNMNQAQTDTAQAALEPKLLSMISYLREIHFYSDKSVGLLCQQY